MDEDALRAEIISLAPWHYVVEVAPGISTGQFVPAGSMPAELGTPTLVDPDRAAQVVFDAVFPDGLEGTLHPRLCVQRLCVAISSPLRAAEPAAASGSTFATIGSVRRASSPVHPPAATGSSLRSATLPSCRASDWSLSTSPSSTACSTIFPIPSPACASPPTSRGSCWWSIQPPLAQAVMRSCSARKAGPSQCRAVHGLACLLGSDRVVREILDWCGFPQVPRLQWKKRLSSERWRMQVLAARDEATFAHYDP